MKTGVSFVFAEPDWQSSAKALSLGEHAQLPTAIEKAKDVEEIIKEKPGFYRFVSNVARRFLAIIAQQEETDPMYMDREKYCEEAVMKEWSQVPDKVVHRWNFSNGYQGLVKLLLPVLTFCFSLPGDGAPLGSRQWIRDAFASGRYTFEHLYKYPKLLKLYTAKIAKELNADGKVKLFAGETVPCSEYYRDPEYKYRKTGVSVC